MASTGNIAGSRECVKQFSSDLEPVRRLVEAVDTAMPLRAGVVKELCSEALPALKYLLAEVERLNKRAYIEALTATERRQVLGEVRERWLSLSSDDWARWLQATQQGVLP